MILHSMMVLFLKILSGLNLLMRRLVNGFTWMNSAKGLRSQLLKFRKCGFYGILYLVTIFVKQRHVGVENIIRVYGINLQFGHLSYKNS